jgi:hypothetical protein
MMEIKIFIAVAFFLAGLSLGAVLTLIDIRQNGKYLYIWGALLVVYLIIGTAYILGK